MSEDLIPEWAEASIRNSASCDNLFGLTWWCSHDPSRRFAGMNALEYDLGLYTNDRRLKPIGARLRKIVAEFDANPPKVDARTSALVIPDGAGASSVMHRFMELVDGGVRPQVVLKGRTHDQPYLRERGIDHLSPL